MVPAEQEPGRETPGVAEAVSGALARTGFARVAPGETPSGAALLAAVGGVRGLVESILPGLTFLIVYTLTGDLLPSVLIPVGVAAAFILVRLLSRSPAMPAVAGMLGIAVSAALALLTGRAEDNFVIGFFVNGIWLVVLAASLAVRRPLIGVIAGLLASEGGRWREDRAKLRIALVATVLWMCFFALRLAVQLPLYFTALASDPVASQTATAWLAGTKLLMGVPMYAAMLWVTWLLVRAVYARAAVTENPAGER